MTKSLQQILAEPDDSKLCDELFQRIVGHHGKNVDAAVIGQAERTVLLVWHVSGVLENGGFRYLLNHGFSGDPDFRLTEESFRTIGSVQAADAIQKTLAIFPNSRLPADAEERLRYYLEREKHWPTEMDLQFFGARNEVRRKLAIYIRSNVDKYAHLDVPDPLGPKSHAKTHELERTWLAISKCVALSVRNATNAVAFYFGAGAETNSRTQSRLAELPHWARVAFAAHCARQVVPLLLQHWPQIPADRLNSVQVAIDVAVRSAEEGRAVGSNDVVLRALMVAGAALVSNPALTKGEPRPMNAHSGTIASCAAKSAEKAAASAFSAASDSLEAATESWSFAVDAAKAANAVDIVERLDNDLSKLSRVSSRKRWTNRTTVRADIWSNL